MAPYGLNGVKITLDGDRDMHNKMRPLRGGQGTFDKIIKNIRLVAGKCRISIGGNFDEESVDTYPALLDFLQRAGVRRQADARGVQAGHPRAARRPTPAAAPGSKFIALTAVGGDAKPLNGTCMTSAGGGTPASATTATSSTTRCRSCARRR